MKRMINEYTRRLHSLGVTPGEKKLQQRLNLLALVMEEAMICVDLSISNPTSGRHGGIRPVTFILLEPFSAGVKPVHAHRHIISYLKEGVAEVEPQSFHATA